MSELFDKITMRCAPSSRMNLLVGTVINDAFVLRVPQYNTLMTEMDKLVSLYGGIFALNLSRFVATHDFTPLFETKERLLELVANTRLIIFIPCNMIQTMYETFRPAAVAPAPSAPLFMFSQELIPMMVKTILILEYTTWY